MIERLKSSGEALHFRIKNRPSNLFSNIKPLFAHTSINNKQKYYKILVDEPAWQYTLGIIAEQFFGSVSIDVAVIVADWLVEAIDFFAVFEQFNFNFFLTN